LHLKDLRFGKRGETEAFSWVIILGSLVTLGDRAWKRKSGSKAAAVQKSPEQGLPKRIVPSQQKSERLVRAAAALSHGAAGTAVLGGVWRKRPGKTQLAF
jgi:hypothetical protein